MAITGISALSGQQIIASGACSARSAATASYTTGGDDLQGLYTTVNSNSGNWNTPLFPSNITADSLYINNNGDITLLQLTGDDSDDYAQTVIHGSGIEFINGQIDPTVIGTIAGNDVSNWNSTYNTVSTNSGSWGGGSTYTGDAQGALDEVYTNSSTWNTVTDKLDTTAQVVTATGSATVMVGFLPRYMVSSINGSAMLPYGFASLSSNSANWNSTYDTVYNNSASWTGGGGDYVETSAVNVVIGTGNYTSQATGTVLIQGVQNTARDYSLSQGYNNSTLYTSFCQGYYNSTNTKSLAQGLFNTAQNISFAQGNNNRAEGQSFAQGTDNKADTFSFAQGGYNTANARSFARGYALSAINSAVAFGSYNLHCDGSIVSGDSAAFVIGDGQNSMTRHDLMLVTKDGEITMYGSTADTVGTGIMSSIRTISASCNIVADTVSSNSGAWGGSALPISAGNGIALNVINGVLVISLA